MDSSSFAFNFGAAATPVQTPSPKKPTAPPREAHGVLPVAIKTLVAACAQGEEFRIFGLPASKVIVCGTIEKAEEMAANKEYRIQDRSGASMNIKDYTGYCAFAPVGSMVRVVGEVRTSEPEPFLSTVQLTLLTDATSLDYHLISATLAHCECTEGARSLDFTPIKQEAPVSQSAFVAHAKAMSDEELSNAIMQTLKSAGESGSPVDAIMRACPGNDDAVKRWVEQKNDLGEIFETGFGDIPHYACA